MMTIWDTIAKFLEKVGNMIEEAMEKTGGEKGQKGIINNRANLYYNVLRYFKINYQ